MGSSPQGSDRHVPWLDDKLVRNRADAEESTNRDLWDWPGHDGIVSDNAGDPDRTGLRSAIGRYVSLVSFPARVGDLIEVAQNKDAPADVLNALRALDLDRVYPNTTELWAALGLSSDQRF